MAAGCVTVPTYTTNTTRDHAHILEQFGRAGGDRLQPEAGQEPGARGADLERMPPRHRASEPLRTGQAPDWVNCPQLVDAGVRRSGRRGARTRDRGASAATTSPASSTPAAPAARRAACSSTTARSSTMSKAAPTSSRPTSAGTTRCSCPSSRRATPTSIPAGSTFPIALGAQIYYAESLEKLAANIEEVQPTIMVVVPRLFEMLRARIMKSIEAQGGLSKYLLGRALKIGGDKYQRPAQAVGPADGRHPVADACGSKVRAKVGGRSEGVGVGRRAAQSRSRHVLRVARDHLPPGLRPDRGRAGDQLQPAERRDPARHRRAAGRRTCEVRIAEDGEIMVRGENRHARLLAQPGGDRARAAATAGSRPATSAISTRRAGSRSPTARRTSSSTTRATTSRRSGSRGC